MKIGLFKLTVLVSILIMLFSCDSNNLAESYRMEKRFWNLDDYENVYYKIKFTENDQPRICYRIPETAPIFKKMVDKSNIDIVVKDESLGLNHRSEFAEGMFKNYRKMMDLYQETNREDKMIYPLEFVDIIKFGLYIQIFYFDLGNQVIIKQADDPESTSTQRVLNSNKQSIIGNFCNYLDYIKYEESLSEEALESYAKGIDVYFPMLIDLYPEANFAEMEKKAVAMLNKAESEKVKTALNSLLAELVDED